MADDDQQAPPQRYWFPYWTSPPAPALRPQPSRRDTRPAQPQPQPPPVTSSPSQRQPRPAQAAATAASRAAAGAAASPQAQPQPTRLSGAHPISPIREPNNSAAVAPALAPKETKPQAKPATPPQRVAHEVPKELDIIVPQEKIIREPPSDTKAHSKAAVEKGKEKDKEKEKEKKDKEKEKEHKDGKEKKEKEKGHKEKKEKDKHKEEHDEHKGHGGKLHKELKAGVADMVQKLGASAAPSAGHHERYTSGAATTVITLAGENKGASMNISHADQAESKVAAAKEHRARKIDGRKQEAQHGAKGMTAFVNSNVQVVNNSLVLQSSCSSSDPGVHLKLSTKSEKKSDGEESGGKGGGAAAAAKKK